jgi:RNA polymerase sigma-70 factor (ECF subfamily)
MPPSEPSGVSGSTDSSLLRRARDRQPRAWHQLVDLYGPLVYSWGRRAHLQPADAADVVQEVFAAVAKGLATFERRDFGAFRAWLRTITGHKVCDHLRRAERDPQGPGGSSAALGFQQISSSNELQPDEPAPLAARAALVHTALEQLRGEVQEHTWQAFWRTTIDDQTAAEVAAALGMKTGAVYQAKSRTLIRLREIVTSLEADVARE